MAHFSNNLEYIYWYNSLGYIFTNKLFKIPTFWHIAHITLITIFYYYTIILSYSDCKTQLEEKGFSCISGFRKVESTNQWEVQVLCSQTIFWQAVHSVSGLARTSKWWSRRLFSSGKLKEGFWGHESMLNSSMSEVTWWMQLFENLGSLAILIQIVVIKWGSTCIYI